MKNKIITFTFVIFLFSISIFNLLIPELDLSFTERRKLDKFSDLDVSKIFSGDLINEFEKTALDQFMFRDEFRSIKAIVEFNIFNKSDNNEIKVIDGNIFKMEYPLDDKSVHNFSDYLNKVYDMYLKNSNVYFSIIPDKNYFIPQNNGFLSLDYDELERTLVENISNMTYVNIKDSLTIKDYYNTDPHWKQENLDGVIKKLSEKMNFVTDFGAIDYTMKSFYPFYGAYYGQSALNLNPDTIRFKISDSIKNAIVINYEYSGDPDSEPGVYDEEKLGEMDSYDVFLSGSTPLITIENLDSVTDKELIIFRDSFSSSLTPLLVEEYSKITLVDLRYVSYKFIGNFVDFDNHDVLFMYSTLVVNNSNILK